MEKLTAVEAIQKYFELRGLPAVTIAEILELTREQRERLGEVCARQLGNQRVQKPPQ